MAEHEIKIEVFRGRCGQLDVVMGAAAAADLCALSFADILDEAAQCGYQRPFDRHHAREFREYIEQPDATTIPLTFNLRGQPGELWKLESQSPSDGNAAILHLRVPTHPKERVLVQVDCQHRLGMMQDSDIPLTFQCFLSLSPTEEMRIFNVINSKAKGLSPSLLDFHDTKILQNLASEKPHLFIAKKLHDDANSVWYGRVILGGKTTQGARRRVTLRGLQHAVALFLHGAAIQELPVLQQYGLVADFWRAVAETWPDAWNHQRVHLLTKGVGVQGLSLLSADIVKHEMSAHCVPTQETFRRYLKSLEDHDWSNTGPFKGFGGRSGAKEVHMFLARQVFAPQELKEASVACA
jgi:DGQHR domain-containing protein